MNNINLPQDRYMAALERIRDRIADGVDLQAEDSTCIGNKYTHCEWGLCAGSKEAWPNADDHLWPDDFIKQNKVAPKYCQENQKCPMDTRIEPGMNGYGLGCFHSCRVFQKHIITPTRQDAIDLFDEVINNAK